MAYPRLEVVEGPNEGHVFIIAEGGGNVLGRHQNAFYRLTDPRVSRQHCEIRRQGETVMILDNGGSGGMLVNGKQVNRAGLRHRDTIQIGNTKLRFLAHADGAERAASASRAGSQSEESEDVDPLEALAGTQFSHFEIGDPVGRGAMSIVFRATDTQKDKAVALKVMSPEFSEDEDAVHRFARVMQTALPLSHPNLVALYGAGKTGSYCWVAMQFVEGESVAEVIARIGNSGMLPWNDVFRITIDVARALQKVHKHGLIHGHVTPNNIRIRARDKHAVLCDLVQARLRGRVEDDTDEEDDVGAASEVDEHSDLYGLGTATYALMTGRPPFSGGPPQHSSDEHPTVELTKPSALRKDIPSPFEIVVLRMLVRVPGRRFASADELVEELERVGKAIGFAV